MCPKQEGFVLNRVRISNPQRLTSTQILLEYQPPPPPPPPPFIVKL